MHKIADIIHAVVILFYRFIHQGFFIPSVHPKLTDAVRAAIANKNVTALQPGCHIADAINHRIGGFFYTKTPVPADDLNKRCAAEGSTMTAEMCKPSASFSSSV